MSNAQQRSSPRERGRRAALGGWLVLAAIASGATCPASTEAPSAPPASATPPPAVSLLPAANLELSRNGEPVVYAGERLFDYIDGGAPQYFEYGFQEMASQELVLRGHTYIFDVYHMRDPLGALGIFSVRRPEHADRLGTIPLSAVTPTLAMFAYGPYFIEISAYESTPETRRGMDELARLGTAAVPATGTDLDLLQQPPFTTLPVAERVAGSERLARGPIGLKGALRGRTAASCDSLIDALQRVLDARVATLAKEGRTAEPPTWVVADYHAREDEDGNLRPFTTLIALVNPGSPWELVSDAAKGIPVHRSVTQVGIGSGWIFPGTGVGEETWAFLLYRGEDALFGASYLPRGEVARWVRQLATGK